MHILLTNDDGVASPALPPLARAMASLGTVAVVAPDGERSWSGKFLSRRPRIPVAEVHRDGVAMLAVGGSPADAAQVGCHRAQRPDLVVSGINLGYNHGSAFVLCSGTVGAAVEAVLTGHTAIALSTGTVTGDFARWRRHAESDAASPDWERLAEVAVAVTEQVLASGLAEHAEVVSVNLPWDATLDTPRELTSVAITRYGPVYAPARDADGVVAAPSDRLPDDPADMAAMLWTGVDDGTPIEEWVPTFTGLEFLDDDLSGTDIGAARSGHVSIAAIALPRGAAVPASVVRRLGAESSGIR